MKELLINQDLIMAEIVLHRGDAIARIDPGRGLSVIVRVWDLIS
jgi:hypothetical protein